MTNWYCSLGTANHLLIHHSEEHINLSNLLKSPKIAWLKSAYLHPTLCSALILGPFLKAYLPKVTFRRATDGLSLSSYSTVLEEVTGEH